jgi:UrcA family protein
MQRSAMRKKLGTAVQLICGVLAAFPITIGAFIARAQTTVDEVMVTGHMKDRNFEDALGYHVSYADLDLRTEAGRKELDQRIVKTADVLCAKLGERDHVRGAAALSCKDSAIKEGRAKARTVKERAMKSSTPFTPGPAWQPPA